MIKPLLIFAAQMLIVGIFVARLWSWRGTEKGRGVLSEIPAMLAYWLLITTLVAMAVLSAWFNLGPLLGVDR